MTDKVLYLNGVNVLYFGVGKKIKLIEAKNTILTFAEILILSNCNKKNIYYRIYSLRL